jgi:hypothetical protein
MQVLAAALAFIVLGAPAGAVPGAPRSPAPSARQGHLLVVIDLSQPQARVLSARAVKRELPRERGPERGWELRVEDASGRVLHRARIPAGGMLRGEQVVGDRMEAITAPDPRAAVAVRVPLLAEGAAIRILARAPGPPAGAEPSRAAASAKGQPGPEVEIARVDYPRVPP